MEAKLKRSEFECYKKTFSIHQCKEESRDAVVPDTQPDIAEVLYCAAKVLIRSKDVSSGRVNTEASVNAQVLYKGEDGCVWSVEISAPFFFSAENEAIAGEAIAFAKLSLRSAEAKALNPRKIILRAELCADICVYEKAVLCLCEKVEDAEFIRCRSGFKDVSLVAAATEKTFAVSDELPLPPAADGAASVICLGMEPVVDEAKSVGTKLIIKGKVKSRLLIVNRDGGLCRVDPSLEFSQIVELGTEGCSGANLVWLTPSGFYCGISGENEGRISLEYHMVAQLLCRRDVCLEYVDEVYSNCYELQTEKAELSLEKITETGSVRENVRLLYETAGAVSEVLCSYMCPGKPLFEDDKMRLPFDCHVICSGDDGIRSEKRRGEVSFRISPEQGDYSAAGIEIVDWALIPVPGGMELRAEVSARLICRREEKLSFLCAVDYDEESMLDNSDKPSLVLLRLGKDDDLWDIARDNCSSVDAILSANNIDDASMAVGRLILIPKTI